MFSWALVTGIGVAVLLFGFSYASKRLLSVNRIPDFVKKFLTKLWFLEPVLFWAGICTVSFLPFYDVPLAAWIARFLHWIAGFFNASSALGYFAGIALVLLLTFAVIDLLDREANKVARTFFILSPFLCFIAAGIVAGGIESAVGGVNAFTTTTLPGIAGR
ncbi:hypothetical protein [Saccharopolyspora griseoalba]|uniref:Uncharacterized protein n=1 Tax=Saccharopolyspora griseoalba TaxID=1431848 RepID=A0ABW2LPX7_9PSEU